MKTTGGITGKGFKKGRSGNPGGRPKTAEFSAKVRDYLARKHGAKTNLETILENLKEHDPKILLYYAFGKPVETQVIQNPDESNLFDEVVTAMARAKLHGSIKLPE